MRNPVGRFLVVAIVSVAFSSCAEGPYHKPLFPVKGQVVVDGQPAAGAQVAGYEQGGVDPKHPTMPTAITDNDGNFELGTYNPGDGAPAGNYKLTFAWVDGGLLSGKPDQLGGRYKDPTKSPVELKVVDGPVDLGKIELTTK